MLDVRELKELNVGMYLEKYSWTLNVLLLVLLALGIASMSNNLVRSSFASTAPTETWAPPTQENAAPVRSYKVDLNKIEERNLFDAKVREEVTEEQSLEAQEATLNVCLQGIIAGPKWNFVTIQNLDDKKVAVFGLGDEVVQGIVVSEIQPDHIVISRKSGRKEDLVLDYSTSRCTQASGGTRPSKTTPESRKPMVEGGQPPPPPGGTQGVQAVSENQFQIDRAFFDSQLSNLNDLVTKARMVPNYTPDRKVDGFRIFQIVPGSIFQMLGLHNGDVIQQVNGSSMDDPTKGLELFQAIKNQSHFTIDLKRMSKSITMTYDVR